MMGIPHTSSVVHRNPTLKIATAIRFSRESVWTVAAAARLASPTRT
jgi:hypothetical protein